MVDNQSRFEIQESRYPAPITGRAPQTQIDQILNLRRADAHYTLGATPVDLHRAVVFRDRTAGCNLLAEAAEIPIRPDTTEYPLADANRALQHLKNDRINGTGVLVVEG